jgi:hypothetical protein
MGWATFRAIFSHTHLVAVAKMFDIAVSGKPFIDFFTFQRLCATFHFFNSQCYKEANTDEKRIHTLCWLAVKRRMTTRVTGCFCKKMPKGLPKIARNVAQLVPVLSNFGHNFIL